MCGIVSRCQSVTSPGRAFLLVLFVQLFAATASGDPKPGSTGTVVIALSPQISKSSSDDLVGILQEIFTHASARLYTATRNGTSFQNVLIVVPRKSTTKSSERDTNKEGGPQQRTSTSTYSAIPFSKADVRVDFPDPNHGYQPYAKQPRGCGQPGEFVHLTPNFLLEWNRTKSEKGINLLVQAWVRYRYGIFDEKGWQNSTRFPTHYRNEDGLPTVTGCTSPYQWTLRQNTSCTEAECQFEKLENVTTISSFMDDEMAQTFCDDNSESQHVHLAPTQHNALCRERSTWSIIQAHDDFAPNSSANVQRKPLDQPQNTSFVIQESSPFTAVLIIDPHLCWVKENDKTPPTFPIVIRKFLRELPSDSHVGFILADSKAQDKPTVISITNNAAQLLKDFNSMCPLFTVEARNVTQGIEDAYVMIKSAAMKNLIVMADGQNCSLDLFNSIQSFLTNDEDLRVYVVTYPFFPPTFEDDVIQNLLKNEHFKWRNIQSPEVSGDECDLDSIIAMDEGMTDIVSQHSAAFRRTKTTVYFQSHNNSAIPAKGTFVIGFKDQIMTMTCFSCSESSNSVSLTLVGKDETKTKMPVVDRPNVWEYSKNIETESVFSYSLIMARPTAVAVLVTTEQSKTGLLQEHLSVHGQVEDVFYQYSDDINFTIPVIRVSVHQGISPVLHAYVEAIVQLPNNDGYIILQLLDNGCGDPDVILNDGIYSRYFTQFSNKSGIYDVRVRVSDQNGAARNIKNVDTEEGAQSPPLILATSYVGNFYALGHDDQDNAFPPNRVTDLQVAASDYLSSSVRLQWTAPGNKLDTGRASTLDLKCATNRSILRTGKSSDAVSVRFNATQDAGYQETHEWKVDECGIVQYCVLLAKGITGKESIPSNVVTVYIPCPLPTTSAPTTTMLPTTTKPTTTALSHNTVEQNSSIETSTQFQDEQNWTDTDGTISANWTSTTPLVLVNDKEFPDIQLSQTEIFIISGVGGGVLLLLVLLTLCLCCGKNNSPTKTVLRTRRYRGNPHYHVDIVRRRWSGDVAEYDDYSHSHVSLQGGDSTHNTPELPLVMTPPTTPSPGPTTEQDVGRNRRSLLPRNIDTVSPPPSYNSDDAASEISRSVTIPTSQMVPLPVLQSFPSSKTPSAQPSTFGKGAARTLRDYQMPPLYVSESSSNDYQSLNEGLASTSQAPRPQAPKPQAPRPQAPKPQAQNTAVPKGDRNGIQRNSSRHPPEPPAYEDLYPLRRDVDRNDAAKTIMDNHSSRGHVNDSFDLNDSDPGIETVV